MTTARPDIVSLLADIDWERRSPADIDWTKPLEGTNACFHIDGEILTTDEMRLVAQAGIAELEALQRYGEMVVDHARSQADDAARIMELTKPHFDRLGEGATLGHVRELLTDVERREFDEVMDRHAPDGYLRLNG